MWTLFACIVETIRLDNVDTICLDIVETIHLDNVDTIRLDKMGIVCLDNVDTIRLYRRNHSPRPVSYTHLTLPTKLSV